MTDNKHKQEDENKNSTRTVTVSETRKTRRPAPQLSRGIKIVTCEMWRGAVAPFLQINTNTLEHSMHT
jgi:hypothetical protein